MCGENCDFDYYPAHDLGSPPRVRGKLLLDEDHIAVHGIHPRVCGEHRSLRRRLRLHRDHPRVCGEHSKESFNLTEQGKSPPRMRGTLPNPIHVSHLDRITPACAGKVTGLLRSQSQALALSAL